MRSPDLTSEQEIDEIIPVGASPLGWGYIPTVEPLAPHTSVHGSSQICDAILCMILQNGFGRPSHNIERHQQELHELNLMYRFFKMEIQYVNGNIVLVVVK